MATLREIDRRRKSIKNTAKVTHAMELVAAAKMRKSQEAALASRPYTNTLNDVLREVRASARESIQALLTEKQAPSSLVIMITTDRGLVGGLNINLFREIARLQSLERSNSGQAKQEMKNVKFIVVGKKGQNFAAKSGSDMVASFILGEHETLQLARTLTKIAIDAYKASEVSSVKIIYPDFQSTIKQIPTITQILPIEFEQNQLPATNYPLPTNLLFEPSADHILENILPHYVLTLIYHALLEAKASEHSARMVAMKNATDAASDLVDDLTLTYNQARQEAITTELLDIVTAQSAFE